MNFPATRPVEKESRPHLQGRGGSTNTQQGRNTMKMPYPRGSERYQRIAPRHHIKGAILDAVGVALLFVFTGLMGCIVLMLSVPR